MFLSDRTIKTLIESGVIGVDPYTESNVQPCSLDVCLQDVVLESQQLLDGSIQWVISAGVFVLGSTVERIRLPANLAASISGKSTLGRRGLAIHITAGWVDPGWDGQLTLELYNHSTVAITVQKGMAIAQLVFGYLDMPAEYPYRGRYQHSVGTVPPR